jgi:leucyl-tRNA synthetase
VLLPHVEDVRPTGTGLSPLAAVPSFVETACPACGGAARRETDVSDTFLDSAWYFLRYPSADVHDRPWDADRTRRVLPVDLYAGGVEHVVRHHLYARFVVNALHDLGQVPFAEPFPRLRLHGLLTTAGAKMSKSRGNVVDPDAYVDRVGADNLRMYLLFCCDWQEGGAFSDAGLRGVTRFTARLWRLLTSSLATGPGGVDMAELDRGVGRIRDDLERLKFNTAIARLMELARWARDRRAGMSRDEWGRVARTLTLVLAPFAPFMAEEAWRWLGGEGSVHAQPWPAVERVVPAGAMFTLVVQVDGRVRDRLSAPRGISRDGAIELALGSERVRAHLGGQEPADAVYVPGRLVNLVGRASRS